MNKNNTVDTAQKGQTTKKDKTPTGKIKTLKSAEERRKAREEQYRNFRINALKRRCDRMGYTKEQFEEFKKKLIEQMNAPKEYYILILCKKGENGLIKEALNKANIKYLFCSDVHFYVSGNQDTLSKIREIVPTGATVHPYAKKMESVLPKREKEVIKKPSNNTAEAKKNAKAARKALNLKRGMHKKGKGKSVAKVTKRKTLLELKQKRKAKTVQMVHKDPSKAVKTAKKAA